MNTIYIIALTIYLLIGITIAIAAATQSHKIRFGTFVTSITSILSVLLLAIFWPMPILMYRRKVK